MWTCKQCNEENEQDFALCWNCGSPVDEKTENTIDPE